MGHGRSSDDARADWPREPADLTDTSRCPACFAPLHSPQCSNCGLDLRHPEATDLLSLSTQVARALDLRRDVLTRMRRDQERRTAAVAVTPPTTATATTPTPVPTGLAEHLPRRTLSAQTVVLTVGVSFLSIAAIFFLVYAFITFGLVWRSVIIGGTTIAAVVVASVLRRRGLRATAEGIAVFAVVLVLLDGYAIRANDLGGLRDTDATVYTGIVLLIVTLGSVLWHRASGLRTPSLVAALLLPIGAASVAGGVSEKTDAPAPLFFALAAAALASALHPLVVPIVRDARRARGLETALLITAGLVASFGSAIVATMLPSALTSTFDSTETWIVPTLGMVAVASIAALHLWVLRRTRGSLPSGAVGFALLLGGSLAAAPLLAGIRDLSFSYLLFVPAVAAAALALSGELVARRLSAGDRPGAIVAALTAAAVGAVGALAALGVAVAGVLVAVSPSVDSASSTLRLPETAIAVAALAAVVLIAGLGSSPLRAPWTRGAVLFAAAATVLLAPPLLDARPLSIGGWIITAIAALAFDTVRIHPRVMRAAWITGLALAWLASWSDALTCVITSAVVTAILVAARRTLDNDVGRAGVLGGASAVFLVGAGALADHLATVLGHSAPVAALASTRFTAVAGVVLLVSAAGVPALSALDRRTVFWIGGVTGLAALTIGQSAEPWAATGDDALTFSIWPATLTSALLPEPFTGLVACLFVLCALVVWSSTPRTRALPVERGAAAVLLAPTVALLLDAFARTIGRDELRPEVAPTTAALLAAAAALILALRRPAPRGRRLLREIGAALVVLPALTAAVTERPATGWLVLMLVGIALVLVATSSDGLIASRSRRRHLGWLALAFGAAALWVRLDTASIATVEAYTLPVAGVLLVVAALLHRARATSDPETSGHPSRGAAAIGGVALLIALVPSALAGASGPISRPLCVIALAAVLLVAGTALRGHRARQPALDAISVAGAAGVLAATAPQVVDRPLTDLTPEAWLAGALLIGALASFSLLRAAVDDERSAARAVASTLLVAVPLALITVVECLRLSSDGSGPTRAIVTVILLAAVHVVSASAPGATAWSTARPWHPVLTWGSVAAGAVVAALGVGAGAIAPLELASIVLAVALLVTGVLRLAAVERARTWPWLGPGVAVLLVPSLVATVDERPLWRLVGLGVAAVVIIAISAVRRLQAPFLIAVPVALVHGFATFAPEIRAVYDAVEWWLWLGVGGVLLIVLAARFERRVRDVRQFAARVAEMR